MCSSPISIPGISNTLADFCSRSFHLLDATFLQELNKNFPIQPSWQLAPISTTVTLNMTSALSSKMSPCVSPTSMLEPPTVSGSNGNASLISSTSTPTYNTLMTQSSHCNYLPIITARETYLPAKVQCTVKRWVMLFIPLARRWPTWDTKTPGSYLQEN